MASVSHQALLMQGAGSIGIDGWQFPLSVVRDTPRRPVSTFNSDGAWLAALAFAASGVKGVQWQQPLSSPARLTRASSSLNGDGAWLAAIRQTAVAGGVPWQQALSAPIARGGIQAPSIVDPSSYAQVWITAAAHPDPYWNSVKLLMGFEGANLSTGAPGMTDESPAAHGTATVISANIQTAQFAFGTSSLKAGAGTAYITFPDSADWLLSSANSDQFTVEFRIRFNATGANKVFIGQYAGNGTASWSMQFGASGGSEFEFFFSRDGTFAASTALVSSGAALTTAVWYALAADKDASGVLRIYKDGVMQAKTTPANSAFFNSTQVLGIGNMSTGVAGNQLDGWIDELRITKGVARYASDSGYTLATAAFPR